MAEQLRRYRQTLSYSYTVGYFATLELLEHRPEQLRRVFMGDGLSPSRRERLEVRCAERGIALEADTALIGKLVHKGSVHTLGVFDKYATRLSAAADHLVLVRPSSPGNVGTIMRTMAAFGVRDLALVAPGVDPFNPHVIRAAVGANFLLNTAVFEDFEAYRARFTRRLYPFFLGAETALEVASFASPCSLVFGPEWPGLPAEITGAGMGVRIAQDGAVESLNLAVAVGIALHRLRAGRQ